MYFSILKSILSNVLFKWITFIGGEFLTPQLNKREICTCFWYSFPLALAAPLGYKFLFSLFGLYNKHFILCRKMCES